MGRVEEKGEGRKIIRLRKQLFSCTQTSNKRCGTESRDEIKIVIQNWIVLGLNWNLYWFLNF